MEYYGYHFIRESDLAHHGILGQKWGVRRYQHPDGTLTTAGKKRYSLKGLFESKKNPGYSIFQDWYGVDERDASQKAYRELLDAEDYANRMNSALSKTQRAYADKYNDSRVHRVYGSGFELREFSNGVQMQMPVTASPQYMGSYADWEATNSLSSEDKEELAKLMEDLPWDVQKVYLADKTYRKAYEAVGKAFSKSLETRDAYLQTPMSYVAEAKSSLKKAANWVKSLFKK